MQGNIYLVGLMGAGKTTVGRKLSNLMERDFLDTDQMMETRTGVAISYIFEVEGESGFRDRESALLKEVSELSGKVISTGGGIVLREENRLMMRESGLVIYLRASLGLLWSRLRGCRKRPLLQSDNPKEKIRMLIEERDGMYKEAADIVVDANSESAAKMAKKIQQMLVNHEDSQH
ncbi:MAG: AAA family ATPase [Gammaproteobacteria bacterium]|nr:AAA family ATPase [Gammaproteobacteria bacterium]NKB64110.1 AAA family ATPase [Gammaproteobacteria bacterium]